MSLQTTWIPTYPSLTKLNLRSNIQVPMPFPKFSEPNTLPSFPITFDCLEKRHNPKLILNYIYNIFRIYFLYMRVSPYIIHSCIFLNTKT